MKNMLVLLLASLTVICNANEKMNNLVSLKGEQYLIECNDLIASLQNEKSKLDISKYKETMEILQAKIINARIKNPVIFENLRKQISNAKKTREYLREDTVHPMIDLALNTFVKRKIEKKEYQKRTGSFGHPVRIKIIQTNEEVAQAREFNQIADLARIEYLWKFAKEIKEIRESIHIISYRNIIPEKGIYIIAENILSKSEDAKTFQNAFKAFKKTQYDPKNIANSALTRLKENKKYDACIPVMNYLEEVGSKETQNMIKSLRPRILQKKAKIDKEKKEAAKQLKSMQIKKVQKKDQGLTLP